MLMQDQASLRMKGVEAYTDFVTVEEKKRPTLLQDGLSAQMLWLPDGQTLLPSLCSGILLCIPVNALYCNP